MKKKLIWMGLIAGLFVLMPVKNVASEAAIIPAPKSVKMIGGSIVLSSSSKIIATQPELVPLASLLQEEILRATGIAMKTSTSEVLGSHIVLKVSPSFSGEAYKVAIGDSVLVEAGNYNAVAMGTVSVLQLIKAEKGREFTLPRLVIHDAPFKEYRGLMVDVGLRWHPADNMKPVIDLCRMYKINYVGMHHNHEQIDGLLTGYTKDVTIEDAKKKNGSYFQIEELRELIAYAKTRGVVLIPFVQPKVNPDCYPDIFKGKHEGARFLPDLPEFWQAYEKKIDLLFDLYRDAPYIHLGAMAGEARHVGGKPEEKAFFQKHGIRDSNEYYIWMTEKIRGIVKKHGKTCMIWEGVRPCDSEIPLSKDVIICPYNQLYYLISETVRDGYPLVNCSWLPLYSVQAQNNYSPRPESVYEWNVGMARHPRNDGPTYTAPPESPGIKGAQLTIWEETYESVLPDLRLRAAAFTERVWNPESGKTFAALMEQRETIDALLQSISLPVTIKAEGQYVGDDPVFKDSMQISCKSSLPGTIRYDLSKNWGSFPTAHSPEYVNPLEITESTVVTFQLFNARGEAVGAPAQERYNRIDPVLKYTAYGYQPYNGWTAMPDAKGLSVLKEGFFGRMDNDRYGEIKRRTFTPPARFGHVDVRPFNLYNNYYLEMKGQITVPKAGEYSVSITSNDGMGQVLIDNRPLIVRTSTTGPATVLKGELPVGTFPLLIRYYAKGIFNKFNLTYTGPDTKQKRPLEDLFVSVDSWKPENQLDSLPAHIRFVDLEKEQNKHLAMDKPVTTSCSPQGGNIASNAVDGRTSNASGWHAVSHPQWLQVDLEKAETIDRLRVVTYFDNQRSYSYYISTSLDGKHFKKIVDMTANEIASTKQGYTHVFLPERARYVRITMTGNSANPGVHLNELMVFGAEPKTSNLYGKVTHSATLRQAAGINLVLEKNGENVAKTVTCTDGSFRLCTDKSGPFTLVCPENSGTIDEELIGIHETIEDFNGIKHVEVISDVGKLKN